MADELDDKETQIASQPVSPADDTAMPVMDMPEDNFMHGFVEYYHQAQEDEALAFAAQMEGGGAPDVAGDGADASDSAIGNVMARAERAGRTVAEDVGVGVLTAPRSIGRGVRNGVQNILDMGYELDRFFNMPAIQIFDAEGQFDLDIVRTRDAEEQGIGRMTLPEIDKPQVETVTGAMIEALSQFVVGLKGVDRAIKAVPMLAGGEAALRAMRGGRATANAIKGMLADLAAFDSAEERLSNLIQEVPWFENFVTEFLQADPNDGVAEAKFKQAVEGLALGGLAEVFIGGVRAVRAGRQAKKSLEEAIENPQILDAPLEEAAGVRLDSGDFEFLGRADSDDLFIRKARKMDDAADEVAAAFGKTKRMGDAPAAAIDDFEINFARINGPDDIKQLMDEMVNRPELKPSIDAARRGVRDEQITLRAAEDVDGFETMMTRRTGEAFNAEQIVAARKVYYDTTEKLMDAARRAAGPQANEIDHFNFRKMVAMHHAVQKEFMGVRAEAGRALAAWRIPVGGSGGENARAMSELLADYGGAGASQTLAKRISAMGDNINTSQLNKMTEKAAGARTIDAVAEAWVLGLMTNPTTHVVNTTDSAFNTLWLGFERFGQAMSKDSPVTFREGTAYFAGMLQSQKLALKNAATALRTGTVDFGLDKVDLPRVRATARDVLDPEGKAGFWSKAMDGYGYVLNRYVRGLLAGSDTYNKTVMYQAQLRALATREATAQGLSGRELAEYVARVVDDPSPLIRADAVDFANYGTYTRQLGTVGRGVQAMVNQQPLLRFVLPFVRTPANIFKYTFERTPLALLSKNVRDDITAGGARAAAAKTKMAMGTSLMAITVEMSMNGSITGGGPSDPKQRAALSRTGWQPYSVKVGDTYYSYRRWGAFGSLLMMASDMSEIMTNYDAYDIQSQRDTDELALAAAMAASNMVLGRTFMSGPADLIQVLSDPQRYGDSWAARMAGSFVPAGVAAVERAIDPTTAQVFNMIDAVKARIPGMSGSVVPRRNIWGEPIQTFYPNADSLTGATVERVMSLFNPVYYSAERDAPVDRWMLANGFNIDMPQRTQNFDGVRIDLREYPHIYDRLVELRGDGMELMRYGNQSMKEFFFSLATEQDPQGRHAGFFRSFGNDFDAQQQFISQVVRDYTNAAKDVLRDEFPELGDIIIREMRNAEKLKAVRPSILDMEVME